MRGVLNGDIVHPELCAAWHDTYGEMAYPIGSQFASSAGALFTVHGPRIGRNSALASAGIAMHRGRRVSTYVYYDGQLIRDNYDSYNVSVGLRVSF